MRLLAGCLGPEEQPRLAIMIRERIGADAQFVAGLFRAGRCIHRFEAGRRFARATLLAMRSEAVGLVIGAALGHHRLHHAVALEIAERAARRIDRDLVEVGRPQPRLLRIEVGE